MRLSIFLEIVNCNFAQTFTIDGTHRQGGRVKIWQMENSCNSKKLGQKNFDFFSIFSKMMWNFCVPSTQFYRDRGLYGMAENNSGFP